MTFSNFITESTNYKDIVDDFDEIIRVQSYANQVTVTGKIKGKEETKRYQYRDPRVALQVSRRVRYFIGIK